MTQKLGAFPQIAYEHVISHAFFFLTNYRKVALKRQSFLSASWQNMYNRRKLTLKQQDVLSASWKNVYDSLILAINCTFFSLPHCTHTHPLNPRCSFEIPLSKSLRSRAMVAKINQSLNQMYL
jgi:hypothetical protein